MSDDMSVLANGITMKVNEQDKKIFIMLDLEDVNFKPSKQYIETNGKKGSYRITVGAPTPIHANSKLYKLNLTLFTYDLPK